MRCSSERVDYVGMEKEEMEKERMEKECMEEFRWGYDGEVIDIMEVNWKKYYQNVLFGLALTVMLFWLAFGISASAMAKIGQEENNQYYLQQERQLNKNVRDYLTTKGYRNSGVTVGRTIFKDGTVEYKVTVHHGMINDLAKEEQETLLQALSQIQFEEDEASVQYEFLQ